jgi:adenylate cyclase, class 2
MLEVEMKFPGADFPSLEKRLAEWSARADEALEEADHYFNAPDRDFARTDEALRLRRIGTANRVTYKGPKRPSRGKTRTEIEVPLAEGDRVAADFLQLLTHLGYRPVAVVHKRRRIYHFERDSFALEVCRDEVDGLGRFAEIEIQAPEEREHDAQRVLHAVANELGLTKDERRSYLELLLAAREQGGTP